MWAGGKNWFTKDHYKRFPKKYKRYIDPFLGGGSVFFYLEPKEAILSDINPELISTYQAIQQDWENVEKKLAEHAKKHDSEYYYKVRNECPKNLTDIAARMIYLNRTCFNGIYRVNKKGKFNVPKGSRDTVITGLEQFEKRSSLLQRADITCCNYEETIKKAEKGDFLFVDPPYAVKDEKTFVNYTSNLFSWNDQVHLAELLNEARKKGVKILMTNVDHPSISMLYEHKRGFKVDRVIRTCIISGKSKGRKEYSELIIKANM